MTHTSDPSPPGETEAAVARLIEWRDHGTNPDVGYTAGNQAFAGDVVLALAKIDDLTRQKAGLEAMLCDAQEEIGELKAKVAVRDDALRPFAETYRRQGSPPAEYAGMECLVKHFARAAALVPKENT